MAGFEISKEMSSLHRLNFRPKYRCQMLVSLVRREARVNRRPNKIMIVTRVDLND